MLTLVYGIETLAVAPSPLGDSSKATSPSFRREIRRQSIALDNFAQSLNILRRRILCH